MHGVPMVITSTHWGCQHFDGFVLVSQCHPVDPYCRRNFQKCCINDRTRCAKALTLVCPTGFVKGGWWKWLHILKPMSGYHCSTFNSQEGEVFIKNQTTPYTPCQEWCICWWGSRSHAIAVAPGAIFRLQNFSLLLGRSDLGCCNLRCSSPIPSMGQ